MFTDLAFIDWLALVFAAVLFAAAIAAAVIAMATSANRPKPTLRLGQGRDQTRPTDAIDVEASDGQRSVESTWVTPPAPSVRPQHAQRQPSTTGSPAHAAQDHVARRPELEADAAVAARAAKLSGRPVPEPTSLHHKRRVQSVVANRTPAHAKTIGSTIVGETSGVASGNFESTDGFKARNPGFFEDPMGRHDLRYWDGHAWTEYVKEHGERFTDPL